VQREGQLGIRVICEVEDLDEPPAEEKLAAARAMTDELAIHELSAEQVQVTPIRWAR